VKLNRANNIHNENNGLQDFAAHEMTSKTGMHAMRSLVRPAGLAEGEFAGAGAPAENIGAQANYLGKLLQAMAAKGLVESRKGPRGGFRLARDPATITLFDVLEPIDRVSRRDACFLGGPVCFDTNTCGVHDRWESIRSDYMQFLTTTAIADLFERQR